MQQQKRTALIGLGGAGRTTATHIMKVYNLHQECYLLDQTSNDKTKYEIQKFTSRSTEEASIVTASLENCTQSIMDMISNDQTSAFVVGLGGASGTKLFIECAKHANSRRHIFICFMPFNFEGTHRAEGAQEALELAKQFGALVYTYPNQDLFKGAHPKETFTEAFNRQSLAIYDERIRLLQE